MNIVSHLLKPAPSRSLLVSSFSSLSTMVFRQLFDRESCTYTYLLADKDTGQAVIIDPVIELAERDVKLVKELDLDLKYVINTHVHADHITRTGRIKKLVPGCQSVLSKVRINKIKVAQKNSGFLKDD